MWPQRAKAVSNLPQAKAHLGLGVFPEEPRFSPRGAVGSRCGAPCLPHTCFCQIQKLFCLPPLEPRGPGVLEGTHPSGTQCHGVHWALFSFKLGSDTIENKACSISGHWVESRFHSPWKRSPRVIHGAPVEGEFSFSWSGTGAADTVGTDMYLSGGGTGEEKRIGRL